MIFLILLCFLVKVSSCFNLNLLQKDLPVAVEVFLKANETSVGSECFQDIQTILQGIAEEQPWARQVLGSSGNRQSKFLWSRKLWLGSRESCLTTPSSVSLDYRILTTRIIREQGNHTYHNVRVFKFFHFGICLPKSCSSCEILALAKSYIKTESSNEFFEVSETYMEIKDFNKTTGDLWTDPTYQTAVGIAAILGILTILSNYSRFLRCFHFPTNYSSTMATNVRPGTLLPVEALKVFSAIWIVLIHVIGFNLPIQESEAGTDILHYLTLFSCLVVDVFFLISGIILAYNFLRNETLQRIIRDNSFFSNVQLYLQMILMRYLRLAPVALVAIILSRMVYLYLDSVDAYPLTRSTIVICHKWYHNWIFLQNWIFDGRKCLSWTWYIAYDMVLFLIFTPILILYAKHPRCARFLLISLTTTGFLSMIYNELTYNIVSNKIPANYQSWFFPRFYPYGAGITFGIVLVTVKNEELLTKTVIRRYHLVCGFLAVGLQFLTLVISDTVSAKFFSNLPRLLSAIFIGNYVCLTHWGYGKFLSRLATLPFCQRINKISYSLFMLHYVVISLAFGGQLPETGITFSLWVMVFVTSIGVFTLTYFVAIFFTATVEIPFQKLAKEFIMRPLRVTENRKVDK